MRILGYSNLNNNSSHILKMKVSRSEIHLETSSHCYSHTTRCIVRVSLNIVHSHDRYISSSESDWIEGRRVGINRFSLDWSTLINQRTVGNFNSYQPSDGDVALLQRLQMSGHLQAAAIFSNFESNLVGRIAESATYCPGISIMPSLCLGRTPCR